MNDNVQSLQVRNLLQKAADERDEARNVAIALAAKVCSEQRWNKIFGILCLALSIALLVALSR